MKRIRLMIVAPIAACLLVAGGCKDDPDEHGHAPAPGMPAADDAHDYPHDHDHGEEPHADEVTLTSEAVARWGIRTEPLTRHVLIETLTVPARVSFNAEAIAHVGSVVSGRVGRIGVRVGDEVKVGDELLVIVSPELGRAQSDYLQSRSAIATTEAAVKVTTSLHERAKSLYDESRGIAHSEVLRREADLRAAEGELIAARSAVTAARSVLHVLGMDQAAVDALGQTGEIDPSYVIRAPIAGRVIEREATLGESVGPDRDALLVIADLSTPWVIADVPETRIGGVRIGSKATVGVPAYPGRVFDGAVAYIGVRLNPATRTIPVRIEAPDAGPTLRPGMFAEAIIAVGDADGEPVAAIPEAAVQRVEGAACVFVPVDGEANTFARRVVRIGPPIGGMVPLLDGLREGERYVAHGSFILKADLGKAGAAHEH